MSRIRGECPGEAAAIRAVNVAALPTAAEADLVDALRRDDSWIPAFSFVADDNGRIVGHLLFTRAHLVRPGGTADEPILALAPMAVLPDHQGRGIGSALVEAAIAAATAAGERLIVVLGHPWFYPRFGFRPARPMGIQSPQPWSDAAWMALPLNPAATEQPRGVVRYPAPF